MSEYQYEPTPDRISEEVVASEIALAFAPLHKRALGTAVGAATGLLVFALTIFHVVVQPEEAIDLFLLREYFYGYTVSWPGAFIGLGWGFFVGFVSGWFLAFFRNLVIAISVFVTRTRVEMQATRDFLDHI